MSRAADIKKAVVNIIKESRGLFWLVPREVKIESIEKVENRYKITGNYECYSFSGLLLEEGSFEIVLDDELELVKSVIKAQR